jgi:hypothetical protein
MITACNLGSLGLGTESIPEGAMCFANQPFCGVLGTVHGYPGVAKKESLG